MNIQSKTGKITNLPDFEFDNCFVAGGAVLSHFMKKEASDWDIYPKNIDGVVSFLKWIDGNGDVVFKTSKAITCLLYEKDADGKRIVVQLMIFQYFPDAKTIFDCFDFTVCMAAWDMDTETFYMHEDFMLDVASRTLRISGNTLYPLSTVYRIEKYKKKGFSIRKGEYFKALFMATEKGFPTSWEEFSDVIGGSYGRFIDPKKIEDEFNRENAFKFLDTLEWNKVVGSVEKIKFSKDDLILSLMKGKTKYYFTYKKGYAKTEYAVVFVDGQVFTVDTCDIDLNSNEYFRIPEDAVIYTHKFVKTTPHGLRSFANANFSYELGKVAKSYIEPYLFSGPKKTKYYQNYGDASLIMVSFPLKDIDTYSNGVFTSKTLKVEQIVDKDWEFLIVDNEDYYDKIVWSDSLGVKEFYFTDV